MKSRRWPVAVIVAAALVAVTTVLLAVFGTVSYVSEQRRESMRLRSELGVAADQMSDGLALPVWNIDRTQIDKIVEGMDGIPWIYGVVVTAAGRTHARVRGEGWRLVPSDGKVSGAGLLVERRPITFSGERIGTVSLFATPRFVERALRKSLLAILSAIVVMNLLLIVCVHLVLWPAVLRPLMEIEKYAEVVSRGVPESAGMPIVTGPTSELENLRSSIQTMVGLLEARFAQYQEQVSRRTESEERFETIFDAVNDSIMIHDVDSGAILDVNATMCETFGYTREEIASLDVGMLNSGIGSFTAKSALLRIRRAAAGQQQLFEWQAKHKDGHLFWTEVNLHAAIISGKQRAIVVARDITERKKMEKQLRAEQDFTDTAVNAMTGAFFVQDREGRYVRWNKAMERLLGSANIRELNAFDLIYPADRARVVHAVDGVFERGYGEVEARVLLKNDIHYLFMNGTRMTIDGEKFLVGTAFDITDRRNAEVAQRELQKEIERSAVEWKQTFDTVTTPILITERSGRIVQVNRAALDLTGIPESDISGRLIQEISSDEPWQTSAQLVLYLAGERSGTSTETRDAQGRSWEITISRFATSHDGAERFILVLWDITGIVELQESLRRSETMSAMGTLVAGVAHEVRNPLFGISATLDAYQEEMSKPGYVEFAATLRREVNRLIHLMRELLEYGKPPALSIERESVAEVVREAVASRQPSAEAAAIEIRNLVKGEALPLLMDRSRIRQVFENLIDNAIQHSRERGVVRITDSVVDHAGRQWVECRVEDEGPGFAVQDLDRVFEPFFTQREGGTGLGLSIVQRIVEEHSGRVSAGNRPEGGGVVRVLFPLGEAAPR